MSIRVGTCSWADDSLSALWYPDWAKSAEGRLRYYAERFDTVELNASFYALPTAETAAAWARRTPDGFIFHVKAFAMMTRHPVRAEQLPPDMRDAFEFDERGRVIHPSRELRGEVFDRFLHAIDPLRQTIASVRSRGSSSSRPVSSVIEIQVASAICPASHSSAVRTSTATARPPASASATSAADSSGALTPAPPARRSRAAGPARPRS